MPWAGGGPQCKGLAEGLGSLAVLPRQRGGVAGQYQGLRVVVAVRLRQVLAAWMCRVNSLQGVAPKAEAPQVGHPKQHLRGREGVGSCG